MATKRVKYIVEVDTKTGKVSIDGLTKGFVNADIAAKQLNTTLQSTRKATKDTADRTGLASAAVVELGRTISDANFGLTAMANNLSQLGTLFATGVAFNQGAGRGGLLGFLLQMKNVLMGPLGIVLGFQTIITLAERFAISAKKVEQGIQKTRQQAIELLGVERQITDDLRKRLEISKDLNDEQAKLLAGKKIELGTEITMLEIRKDGIEEEVRLLEKLESGGFLDALGKEKLADLRARLAETNTLIAETRRLLLPPDDDAERADIDTVFNSLEAEFEQAEITLKAFQKLGLDKIDFAQSTELKLTKIAKQGSEDRTTIFKHMTDAQLLLFESVGDGFISLGSIIGDQTAAGKIVASAGALISTYAAVTKALNTPGLGIGRIPYAVSVGLFGLAQVAQINRVKVPSSSSRSGSSSGGSGNITTISTPPNFNIIGQAPGNQIRDVIERELGKPIRAYVTTKDVRTATELDRNITRGSSIG